MRCSHHIDPAPAAAATVRRWATDVAVEAGYEAVVEVMALLVSELVTNVVIHAGTPGLVTLDLDGRRVRVEVADRAEPLPPIPATSDPLAVRGRGLVLLRELSDASGVDERPDGGKVVWFELLAPRGGAEVGSEVGPEDGSDGP